MTILSTPTPQDTEKNHVKDIRQSIGYIQNIIEKHHDSHIDILNNELMVISNFFRKAPLYSVIIPTLRKISEIDYSVWEYRFYEDGTPITAELFSMLEPSKAAVYDEFTGKVTEPPIMIQELLLLSVYDIQKNTLFDVLARLRNNR